MHTRLVFTAFAASIILGASALTACGGSSSSAATTAPTKAPAGAPATNVAKKAPAAVIDQQNLAFTPSSVKVKVGDVVQIKNSEAALHTGNINNKNITGTMKRGDTTEWTATTPGTYQVTCDFHPLMHATIVVE